MFTSNRFWILANIACTIALVIQLAHVLDGFVKPTITRTWEEEVSLEDIKFPLTISVKYQTKYSKEQLEPIEGLINTKKQNE